MKKLTVLFAVLAMIAIAMPTNVAIVIKMLRSISLSSVLLIKFFFANDKVGVVLF